jgi:hypothetical protein
MAVFMQVAQKLVAAKVKTPEEISQRLLQTGGEKAKKYSNSLWSLMRAFDQSLPSDPSWDEIYRSGKSDVAVDNNQAGDQVEQPQGKTEDVAPKDKEKEWVAPEISNYEKISISNKVRVLCS